MTSQLFVLFIVASSMTGLDDHRENLLVFDRLTVLDCHAQGQEIARELQRISFRKISYFCKPGDFE